MAYVYIDAFSRMARSGPPKDRLLKLYETTAACALPAKATEAPIAATKSGTDFRIG